MLDFLLGLELWQLTLVVLGLSLGIGLVISVGIRIVFRLKPTLSKPTWRSI